MSRWGWVALGAAAVALLVGRRKSTDSSDGDVLVSDEAEALGRVITSEAGAKKYTDDERIAIAWTVRNRARKRRVSIARMVCHPTCGPCCKGRPFASKKAARAADLALARRVLAAPESDDSTGGATAFFEPIDQDWLVAHRREGYNLTSEQLRAKWRSERQTQLATVGRFELWRA